MQLSIAIPDSCLIDESTQLDKTRKISGIARACAIFKINTIYLYAEKGSKQDKSLLATILKYLETPPFLRKRLFPRVNELKYAGVLSPLKIDSHITPPNPKKIFPGSIREGIVASYKGKKFLDVGINQLIPYFGKKNIGNRITVQFKKGFPDLLAKEIEKNEVKEYWGYKIKEKSTLSNVISSWDGKTILTSRKGKMITSLLLHEYTNYSKHILVVFGSTDNGVHEILGSTIKQIQNAKILNFFPDQGTETVRVEEAILGTLSILKSGL